MQSGMSSGGADVAVQERWTIVDEARHPDAVKLLAFWAARAPDGIVMGRDIPSRAISGLLSRIVIWEPVRDGRDLRARLAGAALLRRFGDDIKGRLMSELLPPEDVQKFLTGALNVLENGRSLVLDSRLIAGTVEMMHLEIVVFPVIAPDRKGTWVLAGVFYFN